MNDPKYNISLTHSDGYIIDPDEPIMVLRGKDVGALMAIGSYIKMLMEEHPNAVVNSHLDSSLERLQAFYKYQIANPKLQTVGCSNRNHGRSQAYLDSAKTMLAYWGMEEL